MEISSSNRVMGILKGLVIGLLIPFIGYFLVKGVFSILVSSGLMDEVTSGISSRRLRTITLISICLNMIPIQFLNKRSGTNNIRGIVLATLILAFTWLFYFKDSLY